MKPPRPRADEPPRASGAEPQRASGAEGQTEPEVPPQHPYKAEIEAERAGWYEMVDLVSRLTSRERLLPGYYLDPDWSVRDVAGHVGTWLAEAQIQLERIVVGTYGGHDVDIDALNATFLEAMQGQPWEVAWVQANAGRSMMLRAWFELKTPSDEAAWWIRKAAAEHYAEHLARLREWVPELVARRKTAKHDPSARSA